MPPKRIYLQAGQKFGRLTVVSFHYIKNKRDFYLCKCDCGREKTVCKTELKRGKVKSCGCLKAEYVSKAVSKHKMSHSRIYRTWTNMKARCYERKLSGYKDYGGRGITVCDEWKNNFMAFYNWAMANWYKDNLTIDRINVNGNYEPSNCRWATQAEQNRNKRTIIFITYKGITLCVSQWAKKLGIKTVTLRARLKKGWSIDKALEYKKCNQA